MKEETFKALCRTFGDPELPDDEKWKCLQYLQIDGQSVPFGDVQQMIKDHAFYYIDTPDLEKGFLIQDYNFSDVTTIKARMTIQFIPLEGIIGATFVTKFVADESSEETEEDGSSVKI